MTKITEEPEEAQPTFEEIAAMDFTPWTDRSLAVPGVEDWKAISTKLHVALGVMFKSKQEIIAAIGDLGIASAQGAVEEINDASALLSELILIADGASSRLTIAIAAYAVESEASGKQKDRADG